MRKESAVFLCSRLPGFFCLATPSWLGEVAVLAQVLSQFGLLKAIQERVRFSRPRFGKYDVIDFVVVLLNYAMSGEPALLAFYERLFPFAGKCQKAEHDRESSRKVGKPLPN
jgi:hypothetical protein